MLDTLCNDDTDVSKESPHNTITKLKEVVNPEEKLRLWNQLSLAVFTRCSSLILAASYLTALTHIQLSILAGYTYKEILMNSSQNGDVSNYYNGIKTSSCKLSLKHNAHESFLADGTNKFLFYGLGQIYQVLFNDIIPQTVGSFKLSQSATLTEVSDLLRQIIRSSLFSGMLKTSNTSSLFIF